MTHNTPDKEERERMKDVHNRGTCKCCDNLTDILTSRDTYWKERVEEAYDKGYREGYGDGQDVI